MSYSFVLMPQRWPDAIDYLARPIIGDRGTLQVPWLAISSGVANGRFQLVSRAGLDCETALEIIQAATAQLESQSVVWNVAEQRGLIFKKPYLLRAIVSGQTAATPELMDDLSCEQLVSERAMLAASQTLSAPSLLAVIPKRGWLLVCPGKAGEFVKITEMHDLAETMMARDVDRSLSSNVFFWENGSLCGHAVREESSGYVSLGQPQLSAWWV
ncbi:hypothetical protein [Chamaesiphon polymorphus]|nr:hypothetical protein [Chamaesiphon polymorphus]